MADTLSIGLNRDRPYAIDPATRSFETAGSFMLVLRNEGAGRHVHVSLDGALADHVSIDEGTHFVDAGALWTETVVFDSPRRPLDGTISIGLGYGKERCEIRVRIVDPEPPAPEAEDLPMQDSHSGPSISRRVARVRGWFLGGAVVAMLALLVATFRPPWMRWLPIEVVIGGLLVAIVAGGAVYAVSRRGVQR